jgi:hypothetical protein
MANDRTSAASRAILRGRVAARLLDEAGDTLIEVLIAALLVALIAVATFMGYTGVAHVAGGENTRAQASTLAEADQARLHGLTLDSLGNAGAATDGNYTAPAVTVDGTQYTVTSSSKFVSATGAAACTTSGTTSADEVQTTSTVTWPTDAAAGGPVVIHGLVTPPQGGALIARVVDSSGTAVSGATVSISGGPTSATPLVTDSNGCVEFGGLAGGTYTVSANVNGTITTATAPAVVPTQSSSVTITPSGGNGGITATFTTNYNGSSHASSADQVTAWNPVAPTVYNVFGTAGSLGSNTYNTTVSSGSVYTPGNYTAYAGTCAGDYSSSGYQVAAVANGTTANVTLPEPAMIVDVWGTTSNVETDDPASASVVYSGSGWTHSTTQTGNYNNTESWNPTAGTYVTFTFTGTSVQWIGPRSNNQGYANVLIDGATVATNVNTYASAGIDQQVLFSATGLSNASHTIKILVDGTIPPGSSAAYVPLDAFIVGTGSSGQVDDPVSSSVTYSGSGWTHGGTGSQNYGSTESFDLTAGDYVQFTFTGTSVEWIAPISNNGGYADIYLDGTKVASNITTYNSATVYQQVIWSTAGLANTSHTLKILVDGTHPSGSTANYVQLDDFIYGTQASGLLTVAPLVTLTDNNSGCSNENYPATQVPTATQGALVDPGQPYGNWTVCASSAGVMNTATVANTNYSAGNVVNVYLAPGSTGLTSGSCT